MSSLLAQSVAEAARANQKFADVDAEAFWEQWSARVDPAFINWCKRYPNDARSVFTRLKAAAIPFNASLQTNTFIQKYTVGNETPWMTAMRIAYQLYGTITSKAAFRCALAVLNRKISFATPFLTNSATIKPQLASCFLISPTDDLESIFKAFSQVALCSKNGGGIGFNLTYIRETGSPIKSSGGPSKGIIPWIKTIDVIRDTVNQGGTRQGACAVSLEVWHPDIINFIKLARDLNDIGMSAVDCKYALWVPSLFMRRLQAQLDAIERGLSVEEQTKAGKWSLFSPASKETGLLIELHGNAFDMYYSNLENEPELVVSTTTALDIIKEWYTSVCHNGNPYFLFKDHANAQSMLSPIKTITNLNLCAEISIPCGIVTITQKPTNVYDKPRVEREEHIGTCFLASIVLPNFFGDVFEPSKLANVCEEIRSAAGDLCDYLDRAICTSVFPCEEARKSSMSFRPIGIGIIGMADCLQSFGMVHGTPRALAFEQLIMRTIYLGALERSCDMVEQGQCPKFRGFEQSPYAKGLLQPDLYYQHNPTIRRFCDDAFSSVYSTLDILEDSLRHRVKNGVAHSYLTAVMPTATSSNVTGYSEGGEPQTNNFYQRKFDFGTELAVSHSLLNVLRKINRLDLLDAIAANNGSVEGIPELKPYRDLFKVASDLDQITCVLGHAAARQPYVSQSQSTNIHCKHPSLQDMINNIFAAHDLGLVTASYYVHTDPTYNSPVHTEVLTPLQGSKRTCDASCDSCSL